MLHHLQVLQVRLSCPCLLPLLRPPCLRFRRLRLRLRLRLLHNEHDPPPLLEHMCVLSQLVNPVLARLAPLLPPLDPPLVPLAPKERTCSLKRLVLPLVRPLSRLLARPPCRQGGQCLDCDLPVLEEERYRRCPNCPKTTSWR